jgi:hypothetical protein
MQIGDIKIKMEPEVERAIVDAVELAKEAKVALGSIKARLFPPRGWSAEVGTHMFTDYNTDGETVFVTMNLEQWRNYLIWAEQQS